MKELCAALYQKTGGFIKGICHPDEQYELLRGAGIGWIRKDLPYPFDKEGNLSSRYLDFKAKCMEYAGQGLSSIIITPYPQKFISNGIDVRTEAGLKKASEICEFIAKDYKDMKVCWQVTNEMHILHFRAPLTAEEAVKFIIACVNGIKKGNPDAAVGHNSLQEDWEDKVLEIEEKTGGCDYIGFDLYDGTWTKGGPQTYITTINRIYEKCHKPVILMEFGFASLGGYIDFERNEPYKYLNSIGFRDLDDVRERLDDFTAILPAPAAESVRRCAPVDKFPCAVSMIPHIMKKWPVKNDIPHTEEGQAQFYAELLPMLLDSPYLAGNVIYCWKDSQSCFSCGAPDCPCETAWGLMRCDGTTKPAYDVIKEIWNKE